MRIGQASVLVLLVLAVGLTTGLAVVSRSVTDIATTTTQEESSRSLSAAEAGVEAALSQSSALNSDISVGSSTAKVTTSDVGGGSVDSPEALVAGESSTFKLSTYDSSGNITAGSEYTSSANSLYLCWENPNGVKPAIEATIYYKSGTDINVKRWAFDTDRRGGFDSPNVADVLANCPTGRTYGYATELTGLPSNKLMLRTRLLYNGDTGVFVAIKGKSYTVGFPNQGKDVTSSGVSGDTNRRIQVESRDPDMSPLLDTAVFSGSNLEKN